MKQVDVLRISYYPPSKGYAVMMREDEGDRLIPIIVGSTEAQAIAMAIEGIEMPRPMTHDLMLDIIHSLDVDIKHVVISETRNGTFFAKIILTTIASGDLVIDSRPSDAIAIGLRSIVPIYVEESVLDEVGISESEKSSDKLTSEAIESMVSSDDILDNLNEALEKAVDDEEYEVAARIRDRIKEIEKKSSNR